MQVKIKHLHPDAKTPTYATDGSGCFDLYAAAADGKGYNVEFDTGLAFEVPESHVMLIFSRSGIGFNQNATLCNAVGVSDSDYRGSVKVKYNKDIPLVAGDRIAQAMIIPVEKVTFLVADTLSDTRRGTGGFGSSGQ